MIRIYRWLAVMSKMNVAEYEVRELRVDALNHGLRDIPPDRVRFHTCWGSYHGRISTTFRCATSSI